ncbi:MAG: right-handed parallel beta-helix repeat-containing protein, partial [Treponema sp.]|nr:right-handed parallel beta-helix repeat-containing protein [Treponema sp.]
ITGTTITVNRNSSVRNAGTHGFYLKNSGGETVMENVAVTGTTSSSVDISGTSNNITISGLKAENGGGVAIQSLGKVTIVNSSLEDSSDGFSVSSGGNTDVLISGVRVKNISGGYGTGFYINAGNTVIVESSIENVLNQAVYYS